VSIDLREAANAIYGAWRLALFDPVGVVFFERTPEAALRSFRVAVLLAPVWLVLALLALDPADEAGPSLGRFLVVTGLAYVLAWTVFPLAMHGISRLIRRADRYFVFVTAHNWSQIVQSVVFLPASALAESGLVPDPVGGGVLLGSGLFVLAYEWFVARTVLEVPGATAALIVAFSLTMAMTIQAVAGGML
jgi:hypothetical protein